MTWRQFGHFSFVRYDSPKAGWRHCSAASIAVLPLLCCQPTASSSEQPLTSDFASMTETTKPLEVDDSVAEPTCGHNEFIDAVLGVEHDDHHVRDAPAANGAPSKPNKKSGVFSASANLINFIVGAGIIGMPYAMKQSGLIAGVFLLLLVGWMTDKSLRLLVDMANYHPKLRKLDVHSYEDLASYPFGHVGSNFILFNMMVLAYGALLAYCLIIKDTVPTILGYDEGWQREVILVITTLVIILPLSMQRDMASLAFTSLLSVTLDIVLIVFIAFAAPIKETVSNAGGLGEVLKHEWLKPSTCFVGLGVLSCAMTCQHAAFSIAGSLANRTRARWSAVTYRSIFVATTATGIIGVCGYLGFLDEAQGDVLNNFDPDSMIANAARGMLAGKNHKRRIFFVVNMSLTLLHH